MMKDLCLPSARTQLTCSDLSLACGQRHAAGAPSKIKGGVWICYTHVSTTLRALQSECSYSASEKELVSGRHLNILSMALHHGKVFLC